MPALVARHLVVSTLVLGSFGTIADVAFAKDKPVTIQFYCTTPRFGADRCGDANQNLRVGRGQRLAIHLDKIGQPNTCVTFYVMHAVNGKELEHREICQFPTFVGAWANPNDDAVDVYMNVGSDSIYHVYVEGQYVIETP